MEPVWFSDLSLIDKFHYFTGMSVYVGRITSLMLFRVGFFLARTTYHILQWTLATLYSGAQATYAAISGDQG